MLRVRIGKLLGSFMTNLMPRWGSLGRLTQHILRRFRIGIKMEN